MERVEFITDDMIRMLRVAAMQACDNELANDCDAALGLQPHGIQGNGRHAARTRCAVAITCMREAENPTQFVRVVT